MRRVVFLAVCMCLLGISVLFAAGAKPIQLGLVNPIQIFSQNQDITGIKLNIVQSASNNVTGIDYGFFSNVKGNMKGIQWNWVSLTKGDATAWQSGIYSRAENFKGIQTSWVNIVKGDAVGLQWAIYSKAENFKGFQNSWFNNVNTLKGLQIGLINIAKTEGKGLQIGILNFNKTGFLPVFPLFNFDF